MRYPCPRCSELVVQTRNLEGPNFCPQCRTLFIMPTPPKMPPWILGVLVILVANWQTMV